MEALKIVPKRGYTSEDLDLVKLDHVMPDTWQNISWVIQNGMTEVCSTLRKAVVDVHDLK